MKGLLQSVCRRVRFTVKNPHHAPNPMVREFTSLLLTKIPGRLTLSSPRQIRTHLDKPANTPAFAAHLRRAILQSPPFA